MSIIWKLNRLRAMSAPEIVHRAKTSITSALGRAGVGQATSGPASGKSDLPCVGPIPTNFSPNQYIEAADHILVGQYMVFAMRRAQIGFPPKWNQDPKTGTTAPLILGK